MVFHWSLSDSKSLQVSRTLLSILAVLNNAVVWMVSTRPPNSKSSRPPNNILVTVPNAPITIGIIITFMFHSFFNSQARSRYLSFFSHFLSALLCDQPVQLLIIIRSGLLTEIRRSVCMSMSHRSLCVSFSRTAIVLCINHLFVWSNLNFFHISKWITLSVLSCLVLYSFCANFCIRLLYDWSFRLYHHITYIFYFVTSYLFSFWFHWFLWRCFVLLLGEIQFLF